MQEESTPNASFDNNTSNNTDEIGVIFELAEGGIQSCNAIVEQVLGLKIEQIQGKRSEDYPWQTIYPDGSRFVRDKHPVTIALQSGKACTNRTMGFYHPNGELVWLLLNSQPLFRVNESQPYAVVTTFRKIEPSPPKHQTQTHIHQQFTTLLIENSKDFIGLASLEGEALFVNQAGLELVGLEDVKAVQQTQIIDYFMPEDRDYVQRVILPTLMCEGHWHGEFRFRHFQTGRAIAVDYNLFLVLDEQKTPIAISTISRNISRKKQIEEELWQRNAILRVINESAPTPIFVKNREGRIIYANPATLEVLGKTAEEVIGYRDCDLYPSPELGAIVTDNDKRIMESGQTEVVEESPDGIRTFLGMKSPYRNEVGEIIGLIGISNDITARVQLEREREKILQQEQAAREEAEKANRIKDEFLAILSHELRTPLNPILGWSKLLQRGKLKPEQINQALETIVKNATLQSRLIEDLLDMSQILRGKLSLHKVPIKLPRIIEAAIETVKLPASAKNIQIQTTFAPNTKEVLGDESRLQQIIWNLLSNAVKFTPDAGKVQIQLTQLKNYIQIQVSDTGKGINPDFLPYVFERFRQEDSSITRKFGGLGLGLAIVRQLVELHDGNISVISTGEGKGTTFTIQLPYLKSTSNETRYNHNPNTNINKLPLQGLKILVIDDEADSCDLIAFILEQEGATVQIANSAIVGLQILAQAPIDLLVSDIGMPQMDGYSLINHIRTKLPPQLQQISAIALTAYAGEANERKVLDAGFQKHLTKPVNTDELITAIVDLAGNGYLGTSDSKTI